MSYDVSVVVATYHPSWEAIEKTMDSLLGQKGISLQIVVADDGSKKPPFEQIEEYFKAKVFADYKMVPHDENQGTVRNLYDGVRAAEGNFIKLISPGDYLYSDTVLKDWIALMEERGATWSFGEVVSYQMEGDTQKIVQTVAHPQNAKRYEKGSFDQCRWNYTALADWALGAATLCKREGMQKYLQMLVGKVVYAEDNMYRIMMYDGVPFVYYPENVVYYEYGGGVSTSKNDVWTKRLLKDLKAADEIILSQEPESKLQRQIQAALKKEGALAKCLIKGKLSTVIRHKACPRLTPAQ